MPHENEKPLPGCTNEYCVKPGTNNIDYAMQPTEVEISIINNMMQENNFTVSRGDKKD